MQYEESIRVAFYGLFDHKFRSFLTMLGIIFGTASVIMMISIGEGTKEQAMAKYQDLGVSNVIVRDRDLTDTELEQMRIRFSKGLTRDDSRAIAEIVPGVLAVAPQAEATLDAVYENRSSRSTVIGITPEITDILSFRLDRGDFINHDHYNRQLKVCVLGANVARELFNFEDPVGMNLKLGDQWFEVVGVLKTKALFTETVGELAARDLNNDIYIPLTTFSK
ncbi:MAG: ABC transporter permease, partial [Bacteroidetes bacterium]|nr:ABC transporter permease [Bacteroidota bacterium]